MMKRFVLGLLLGSAAVMPLVAQSPRGWRERADRSTSATDPDAPGSITFVTSGSGFRAGNPQAAVFWNPANVVTGSYSVTGTFTLLQPSNHTNYYGIVFGGRDLEGASQSYLYFLVAQDGTWLVKRRNGDALAQTVLPKTASSAIRVPDASGRSVNALEVRVTPGAIAFLVNGTVVNAWSGAERTVRTNGIYGIRVNHFLDVQVDGFAAAAAPAARIGPGVTSALTAPVDRVLSPTAFLLSQDTEHGVREVTVSAPALQRPVDAGASVTVFGELTAPDDGRAALRATSVLTAEMVDLTKRLPPPMSADDKTIDGFMQRISPAFAALRQAIDGSNAEAAARNAAALEQAFAGVEAFWNAKAKADAATWARTARLQAAAIPPSAGSGQWEAAKTAAATLGQQCPACHTAYRDAFDDNSFRIRIAGR
jgi:hypothetical protein